MNTIVFTNITTEKKTVIICGCYYKRMDGMNIYHSRNRPPPCDRGGWCREKKAPIAICISDEGEIAKRTFHEMLNQNRTIGLEICSDQYRSIKKSEKKNNNIISRELEYSPANPFGVLKFLMHFISPSLIQLIKSKIITRKQQTSKSFEREISYLINDWNNTSRTENVVGRSETTKRWSKQRSEDDWLRKEIVPQIAWEKSIETRQEMQINAMKNQSFFNGMSCQVHR